MEEYFVGITTTKTIIMLFDKFCQSQNKFSNFYYYIFNKHLNFMVADVNIIQKLITAYKNKLIYFS